MRTITVTQYVANDGKTFTDEAACLTHEHLLVDIAAIMAPMGRPFDDANNSCTFANGHGWIEHDVAVVYRVAERLLDEIAKTVKHRWVQETRDNIREVNFTYVGRLVGELPDDTLYKAWLRICCVDIWTGREYGQMYYALHPAEAEGPGIKPQV